MLLGAVDAVLAQTLAGFEELGAVAAAVDNLFVFDLLPLSLGSDLAKKFNKKLFHSEKNLMVFAFLSLQTAKAKFSDTGDLV